jgi:hypothetical protein
MTWAGARETAGYNSGIRPVKLDEDLPSDAAELLRGADNDVTTVLSEGLGGTKDSELWTVVQLEGRFFVTADKGFGDVRVYPPGSHAGILLLRPYRDGIGPLLELFGLY